MKRIARIAVTAYVLAILLASFAPHCAWMFGTAQAATPQMSHADHGNSRGGHTSPSKSPERECAAMEMAKSIGPVPAVLVLASPDLILLPAILAEPPTLANPAIVNAVQPRGPPRTHGGFAAVFACNHRLLI